MENKNPLSKIKLPINNTVQTFDVKDNTLIGSSNITITTNVDKTRTIDIPTTATPTIASLTTTGDVNVGGKIVTGHIEAPSTGSNDTVSIDDRLAVSSTSNFNGDVFVGGWEQLTPGGS